MPQVEASRLEQLCGAILEAAGASPPVATSVAAHIVGNDLKGVGSHGASRIPYYLRLIREGYIDPRAEPAVARSPEAGPPRIDGGGGFGIVAMERAVEVLAAELDRSWIAAAGIVNVAHTGRIGAFAERIAAGPTTAGRGCLALILGGGGHATFPNVAPFGGARGVHSTNPYALALPGGRHGPIVVDFATSATAQGKLMVARMKGEAVPEGLILDRAGRPTTNPNDFYDGGALLPAAGPKGYGLGLVAELVGSALLAAPHEFNWLILALKLESFRDPADYAAAAEAYLDRVKACPPAEGFSEVHLPGEIERATEAERRRDGIPLADDVWEKILAAGRGVGVGA